MNAKAKGTRNEHRTIRLLEAAGHASARAVPHTQRRVVRGDKQ